MVQAGLCIMHHIEQAALHCLIWPELVQQVCTRDTQDTVCCTCVLRQVQRQHQLFHSPSRLVLTAATALVGPGGWLRLRLNGPLAQRLSAAHSAKDTSSCRIKNHRSCHRFAQQGHWNGQADPPKWVVVTFVVCSLGWCLMGSDGRCAVKGHHPLCIGGLPCGVHQPEGLASILCACKVPPAPLILHALCCADCRHHCYWCWSRCCADVLANCHSHLDVWCCSRGYCWHPAALLGSKILVVQSMDPGSNRVSRQGQAWLASPCSCMHSGRRCMCMVARMCWCGVPGCRPLTSRLPHILHVLGALHGGV